jgi:hypothetical protein
MKLSSQGIRAPFWVAEGFVYFRQQRHLHRLDAELFPVAEIAEGEPIQKPEAGDPVETSGSLLDGDSSNIVIFWNPWNTNGKQVNRKGSCIRAAELNGIARKCAAEQAVFFIKN